jgi:hypothetical protein
MRKSTNGRFPAGFLLVALTILTTGGISAGASRLTSAESDRAIYGWTQHKTPGPFSWSSVASSSDGTKLVAACYVVEKSQFNGGYIHTSVDSGKTWTERAGAGARLWSAVASSSDGTKLAATAYDDYIYTSTDSGATWTPRKSAGKQYWITIASSSDGTKLVSASTLGYIYTSTDSGATWTKRAANLGSQYWVSVASSSDGTELMAAQSTNASGTGGYLYGSSDSGKTWHQWMGRDFWQSVACSSDGTKLAAAEDEGYILTSTDSGTTWTRQTGTGDNYWSAVALSSDGTTLIATAVGEYTDSTAGTGSGWFIYTSNDFGSTWTMQAGAGQRGWSAVASSFDGSKLIAAVGETWFSVNWSGYLYTASASPTSPLIDDPVSSSVTTSSATLGGDIGFDGGSQVTAAGVAYGTSRNPGIIGNKAGAKSKTGAFTVHVTGLSSNTQYYFRGYATNSHGTGYTDDAHFTTLPEAPKAKAASNPGSSDFTANWTAPPGTATIKNYQLDVATDRGFLSFLPGFKNRVVSGTKATVTGLTSGKTYYYRVRAVNAGGVSSNSNIEKVLFH